jgi:amino acid transporter
MMETERRLWRSAVISVVCLGLASIAQPISDYLRYIGSASGNWLSGLGTIFLLVGAIAFMRSHWLVGRLKRERGLSERLPQTGASAASTMKRGDALTVIVIGVVMVSSVVGLVWLRSNASDPVLRLSIDVARDFALPSLLLLLVVETWRHRLDEGKIAKLS